ncbi:MAG: PHB depolymerase family esterase [Rhizobacter sp.]
MRSTIAFIATGLLIASPFLAAAADSRSLVHDGLERHYTVRMPDRPAGERLPLVLVLHGGAGNAENIEATTGFTDKARREGFIVVYPEGTGRFAHRLLAWNATHCCGPAMTGRVDDVGFIRALLDKLSAELPVDTRRVYATGMSNGGMMVHRLGIALPDRFAAIAPVVATVFGDEPRPASPVAALMVNGALDTSVPPAGGPPGGRVTSAWDGTPTRPARAQGDFWAAANGCAPAPDSSVSGTVNRMRYRCEPGREVEVLLVGDNGHAWPGGAPGSLRGDRPSRTFDATDAIWAFFQAHAK